MLSPEKQEKQGSIQSSPLRMSSSKQGSNRGELKKLDQDLTVAKNRLINLRQQLQKQKDSIKKNKALTQQVINKKVAVNSINSYKLKDNSQQIARIQSQKKKNLSFKLQHEKSLQNIQKAIYLVKLDDARQVKNISQEHRRRIRQMENDQVNKKYQKKKQLKEQSQKAKQRYMRYWKQKLSSIYAQQAMNAKQQQRNKQQKLRELKMLQEQQIRILQQINVYHQKHVQTKKEYVAALSLPVKQVAMAIGNNNSDDQNGKNRKSVDFSRSKSLADMQSKNLNKSKNFYGNIQQNSSLPLLGPKLKVPHTNNVNETKLKIILQQLKRIQKNKQRNEQNDGQLNKSLVQVKR